MHCPACFAVLISSALLRQGTSERDVQDRLVELLLYDNFPLIKQLLANRTVLVWCTRLQRAQNDTERSRIEVGGLSIPP